MPEILNNVCKVLAQTYNAILHTVTKALPSYLPPPNVLFPAVVKILVIAGHCTWGLLRTSPTTPLQVFKHESFTKIKEFRRFRNRLRTSIVKMECGVAWLLGGLLENNTGEKVREFFRYDPLGCAVDSAEGFLGQC